MFILSIFSGFLPLAVLGGIVWAIYKATNRDRQPNVDPAASVRRVIVYGLLFVTLIVAAVGLSGLAQDVVRSNRANADVAQSLALVIVGVPAFGALLVFCDRKLADSADERNAASWTLYLNVALLVTLIVAIVRIQSFAGSALGDDAGSPRFETASLIAGLVWAGAWALHWFGLKQRHGIDYDYHLASGTITGLVTLAIGLGGVFYVGIHELYVRVVDDPTLARGGPRLGNWVATMVVGGAVWGWYWLANFRTAQRTETWLATVVPVGSLAGFVAVVAMLTTQLRTVAVWFFGNPDEAAARHFDLIPGTSAVLLVGLGSWIYHRAELVSGADTAGPRTYAERVYEYLLAAAALVVLVVGVVMVLANLLATGANDRTNPTITGVVLIVVGATTWGWFWQTIRRATLADRSAEISSPIRKIYLFALFGSAAVAILVSFIATLGNSLEDLLNSNLSRSTLHDNRYSLAVIVAVTQVAWFHGRLYLAERLEGQPEPPAPAPTVDIEHHVVVVTGEALDARELSVMLGADVEVWQRESFSAPIDIGALRLRIAQEPSPDLLVIAGPRGCDVIPVQVPHPPDHTTGSPT